MNTQVMSTPALIEPKLKTIPDSVDWQRVGDVPQGLVSLASTGRLTAIRPLGSSAP